MAKGLNTRTMTLVLCGVALASFLAVLILSVCYGMLRLWLEVLVPFLSPTANAMGSMTILALIVTAGFFWLYAKLPRVGTDDRQRVIDCYTPGTMAVLFCSFVAAMAATIFSAKFGIQLGNELIGRPFFSSKDFLAAGTFLNVFYWGVMILLVPTFLLRCFESSGELTTRE